jgi:hypothetical protein
VKKLLGLGLLAIVLLVLSPLPVTNVKGQEEPVATWTAEEEGGLVAAPYSCQGGECSLAGWCVGQLASFDGCTVQCYDVDDQGWLTPVGSADCGGES